MAGVGPEEDQDAEPELEGVEPRLRSIEYKEYIEHAMRWHDGRFARHPTFRFVAFITLMRAQSLL